MSQAEITPSLRETAAHSSAWPFEEARKIVAQLRKHPKDTLVFETGYGPSGLPHIGTFGEVARTTMVRHAFRVLTGALRRGARRGVRRHGPGAAGRQEDRGGFRDCA